MSFLLYNFARYLYQRYKLLNFYNMAEKNTYLANDLELIDQEVVLVKKKKSKLRILIVAASVLVIGTIVGLIVYLNGQAYKSAILADAPIVLEINVRSLAAKSELESYKEEVADLVKSIDPEDEELQSITESITDEKKKTGINFFYPIYAFTNSDLDEVFVLASVKDKEDLIKTIESVHEDIQIFDSSDDIAWIEVNDVVVGGISDNAVLIGTSDSKSTYKNLLSQKRSNSFFRTDAGKFMKKHTEDVTLMVDFKNMSGYVYDEIERSFGSVCEIDDLPTVVVNLEFSSGEVALNFFLDGVDEEVEDIWDNLKLSEDVFEYIPTKNLAGLVALPLDGPQMLDEYDDKIKEITNNSTYKVIRKLLNTTEGTAILSIYNNDPDCDPDILCIIPAPKSKIKSIIKDMYGDIPSDMYIDGDDAYTSITTMSDYTFSKSKQAFDGDVKSSFYAVVYVKEFIKNISNELKRYVSSDAEKNYNNKLIDLLELINNGEVIWEDVDQASIKLNFTDDSKNILELLLEHSIQIGEAYLEYLEEREHYVYPGYDPVYYHDDYYYR